MGIINIWRAHLDTVICGIAHQLCGCVKPHGLRIQQRRTERVRVVTLKPAGHVNQLRKACRVAFRETIFTKAFDLIKTAPREVFFVTARHHPPDHLVLQQFNCATGSECRHRLAQLIGLGGGKFSRLNRDLHSLFLKNRHAQCAPQNVLQFGWIMGWAGGRVGDDFLAVATPQIRMHHVTLNRTWAHDRDLDHQIIKRARTQAWQHIYLGAAFHLKHPDAVAFAQHLIDARVFFRDSRKGEVRSIMC